MQSESVDGNLSGRTRSKNQREKNTEIVWHYPKGHSRSQNGVSKQSLRTKLESVAIAAVVIVAVAVVAEKG